MKKIEAMRELTRLSDGTMAILTGETNYSVLRIILNRWLNKIEAMDENAFQNCENWMDVYNIIG